MTVEFFYISFILLPIIKLSQSFPIFSSLRLLLSLEKESLDVEILMLNIRDDQHIINQISVDVLKEDEIAENSTNTNPHLTLYNVRNFLH